MSELGDTRSMGRIMAGWSALALLAVLSNAVHAASPPQEQRRRELIAVIDEAIRRLGDRPIDAVERVDAARYRLRAGSCVMDIRIIYLPRANRALEGPAEFAVSAGEPRCS